ncbi:MAG: ATP-binding cassette domain-containing protein [Halieaceae bacterium]|nr:ATP-binding cassette domain-containing protein [Halieaceae bacterium]
MVARLALFAWYFAIARAIDAWLVTGGAVTAGSANGSAAVIPAATPAAPAVLASLFPGSLASTAAVTLLVLVLLAATSLLRHALHERAAIRAGRYLFGRMLTQLRRHRRALIRRKPLSAWQDFHSRHLPALETYLIDYRLQRRLVATLPLLVLALILPLSWLAAVTLLVTMPLIPLFMWLVGRGAAALQQRHILALDRLGGLFGDRIAARRTVRLHNAGAREIARFDDASRSLNERLAAVLRVAFLSGTVLEFFSTLSIALVAVFTGFALLGELPFGFYDAPPTLTEALFILLVAPAFFAELKTLGHLYHSRSSALGAAAAWDAVLTEPERTGPPSATRPSAFTQIEVRDGEVLGFDGEVLLRLPQLTLHRGDHVLLRGPSGAGKSVLLEALAGLRPMRGEISLDGRRTADLAGLRDTALLMEQTPALFAGSVASNVGLDEHDDQAVVDALEAVGLGPWLAGLANGVQTCLGDHPALSGGQRQRLAAARLLLFRPALVLLDEPTAHLSEEERQTIADLLQALLADSTVVWASHDPLPRDGFDRVWSVDTRATPRQLRT